MQPDEILALIEKLTGQDCPLLRAVPDDTAKLLAKGGGGVGHSQFNELLLTLGYDRATHAFFQFLVDGETTYVSGNAFRSAEQFRSGVERFRKVGMSLYGNVKYAFKRLSSDKEDFLEQLAHLEKRTVESFQDRHPPIPPMATSNSPSGNDRSAGIVTRDCLFWQRQAV